MAKFMTFETCPYCGHLIETDPADIGKDFCLDCDNCNRIIEHDRRELTEELIDRIVEVLSAAGGGPP